MRRNATAATGRATIAAVGSAWTAAESAAVEDEAAATPCRAYAARYSGVIPSRGCLLHGRG